MFGVHRGLDTRRGPDTRRGLDGSPEGEGRLKRKLTTIQRPLMSVSTFVTMRGQAMVAASKTMAQQVGVGYAKSRRQTEDTSLLNANPGNANPEHLQGE